MRNSFASRLELTNVYPQTNVKIRQRVESKLTNFVPEEKLTKQYQKNGTKYCINVNRNVSSEIQTSVNKVICFNTYNTLTLGYCIPCFGPKI